jgi:hypothetical protein
MRRWLILVLSVAFAVSVFAPVAAAQGDDGGVDDRGGHTRGTDDRGFDDRGMHARGDDDRGFDDKGMNNRGADDDAVASPVSSASASASATSSASASASATSSASASASDDKGFDDRGRGMDDRAVDENTTASPASSASASASPGASPSASPTASPSASPTPSESATASATPVLPDTSGFPPAWVLGPLAMILGGGLMALGIVRRR